MDFYFGFPWCFPVIFRQIHLRGSRVVFCFDGAGHAHHLDDHAELAGGAAQKGHLQEDGLWQQVLSVDVGKTTG